MHKEYVSLSNEKDITLVYKISQDDDLESFTIIDKSKNTNDIVFVNCKNLLGFVSTWYEIDEIVPRSYGCISFSLKHSNDTVKYFTDDVSVYNTLIEKLYEIMTDTDISIY